MCSRLLMMSRGTSACVLPESSQWPGWQEDVQPANQDKQLLSVWHNLLH